MPVQLYLQLPDQIILGVQLQLQLVDESVPLPELLDLQLQSELKVPQSARTFRHSHEHEHRQIYCREDTGGRLGTSKNTRPQNGVPVRMRGKITT